MIASYDLWVPKRKRKDGAGALKTLKNDKRTELERGSF